MADNWHIVKQEQDTELSETGPGFEHVWVVTYKIDDGPARGTRGQVRIPFDQHNKDTVLRAISAQVHHIEQVASL